MADQWNPSPPDSAGKLTARVMLVMGRRPPRDSLSQWLSQAGCRVLEAEDDAEALTLLAERVDVVLLDMRPDDGKGLSLLRRIKHRFPATEVIMLVGRGQIPVSIEGMKSGAFDDLAAPVEKGLLLGKVRQAWERKRANASPGVRA